MNNEYTSYETSKALYEAGFKGETRYKWIRGVSAATTPITFSDFDEQDWDEWERNIPAYTFNTIWEALPDIKPDENDYRVYDPRLSRIENSHCIGYYCDEMYDMPSEEIGIEADSPTEAAAQLLLWAIKEGHVKV
jgi:hypothetical protein